MHIPNTARAVLTRALSSVAGVLLLATSPAVQAQYPERPVKIINPYAPGGSGDTMQRLFAQKLAERTGKSFVVENKTGAAGRIAYDFVAKSRPDGYTLIASDPGYSVLPALFNKLPWDHQNDFIPVTMYARTPHAVVVSPQSRFKTLTEVIQYARTHPDKVTFGHSGAGTTGFIVMQQLMREAKVDMTHVPFKGGGEILGALMSNSIDLMVTGAPTIIGHMKNGTLRVLALTSDKRWPGAESVPTLMEQGVNVTNYLWFSLMAPKGTPPAVVDYLHKQVAAILEDSNLRETLRAQAAEGVGMAPAELAKLVREDTASWGQILRAANITAE